MKFHVVHHLHFTFRHLIGFGQKTLGDAKVLSVKLVQIERKHRGCGWLQRQWSSHSTELSNISLCKYKTTSWNKLKTNARGSKQKKKRKIIACGTTAIISYKFLIKLLCYKILTASCSICYDFWDKISFRSSPLFLWFTIS